MNTLGWSEEEREAKRAVLHGLLTAVACSFPEDVYYYQVSPSGLFRVPGVGFRNKMLTIKRIRTS